ncbi:MBL fold metallo-hydrolase, partial [Candidatus Bipolaricaulota bacterium]|nr:MBL fold metallo-hydrolase [Candidatus Bipolaricaulota bacterium]
MSLHRVDRLEILVVVDNYADTLLSSSPGVIRPAVGGDGCLPSDTLLAEHGLCLLLTVERGGKRSRLMLDGGYSPVAAPRNLRTMGIEDRLDSVAGFVISHGHEDHVGAALELAEMMGKPPLLVHPEAFHHPRFFRADDGTLYQVPEILTRSALNDAGIDVLESDGPRLVNDVFLVTGEIPRITPFEHGLPGSLHEMNGKLVPDAVIDDQAVVVDVDGHGLVVVSGCAHA